MTEERLPWFPCYPSKLLGALAGMQPHEGYVYWVVCLRIYETGRPCRDSADVLARRTGLSRKRVSEALDLCFNAGRLVQSEGGISNPFASEVIAETQAIRDERSRAGKEGASKRWGKGEQKQSKPDGKANAKPLAKNAHLQEQEEPKGSSPLKPPDDWPDDFLDQFWNVYPPFRRTAKKAVAAKLLTLRKNGEVTFAVLMAGLLRYVATNPGEYAKGPVVWINGGCWMDEHGGRSFGARPAGSSSGAGGFGRIASKIEQGRNHRGEVYTPPPALFPDDRH